jgi:hypothetical protein
LQKQKQKCGADEEWRRTVGPIVCEMKKCQRGSRRGIKRRKANWIRQILHKNRLLKHVTEEKERKMQVRGRLERRCKQLLDALNETRVASGN